jgi:hypothetical protein
VEYPRQFTNQLIILILIYFQIWLNNQPTSSFILFVDMDRSEIVYTPRDYFRYPIFVYISMFNVWYISSAKVHHTHVWFFCKL